MRAALAKQDTGRYLMQPYNWRRPHQFNQGSAPAVAEEKRNAVSGISWPLHTLGREDQEPTRD